MEQGQQVRLLTITEALEQLDVHALKFVFQSHSRAVKAFWFLLFLSSLFAAGYYIYQIVVEFHSEPTATKVSAVEQATYDYPQMYICSRDSLNTEKMLNSSLPHDALIYAASLIQKPDSAAAVRLHVGNRLDDAESDLNRILNSGQFKTYKDFYSWLSFNFSGVVGEEPGVVDPTNFPVHLVANPAYDGQPIPYRVCYEAEVSPYTPNIGDSFYIQYEMKKPDLAKLLPSGLDNDFFVITSDHRVVLEKERIGLRRNRITTIRLSVKKYVNLNHDANPCMSPEKERAEKITYKYCRHRCYTQAVEICHGCTVLSEDTEIDKSPPSTLCSWFKVQNLSIECPDAREPYQKCVESCQHPCEYFTYEFSLTASVINHTYYQDDRIALWLYYEVDDGILVYEEIPTYTWASMVSNIGGQLGLWCGASLLTGLELIYLLSHVSYANWRAKRRAAREANAAGKLNNVDRLVPTPKCAVCGK